MNSEDDKHDAKDYYNRDAMYSDDEDEDEDDGRYEFLNNDSDDNVLVTPKQKNYTILKEADIRQRQEDDIATVCSVLSISKNSACILLHHHNWNISSVHEAWFANEDKVRRSVGLLDETDIKQPKSVELPCGICSESNSLDKISRAACGHPFCNTCWTAYISKSISDGPGCLTLRCPISSCGAAVGVDMVNTLTSDEDKKIYRRYLFRSYIEHNKKIKWCPAPGCDYAIEFNPGSGIRYDVTSHCSYRFCWNCTEEAHHPADCESVSKWLMKDVDWESGSKCFTKGNAESKSYESAKQEFDESEIQREKAKNALMRYTQYYEHWATNQSLRQKALAELHQMETVHLLKLSEKLCEPEIRLKFIIEAWLQIVECRRVLKWAYVYGYFLPEHEHAKRQFIEYLLGEAEASLKRLHQCAEKELHTYLYYDGSKDAFNDFRTKLSGLTSDTRDYFENLVRTVENGLSDVDAHAASSKKKGTNGTGWSCDREKRRQFG